eukprot:6196290-Pleurochrysis_carterae.AAC.1
MAAGFAMAATARRSEMSTARIQIQEIQKQMLTDAKYCFEYNSSFMMYLDLVGDVCRRQKKACTITHPPRTTRCTYSGPAEANVGHQQDEEPTRYQKTVSMARSIMLGLGRL